MLYKSIYSYKETHSSQVLRHATHSKIINDLCVLAFLNLFSALIHNQCWSLSFTKQGNVGVLAGVCAFEVGIDGFCEGSCHWQSVLWSHGERTGSSGASC